MQEHTKPRGLIVRRCDGKLERIAGLVPHPAVIAGDYVEAVLARGQIRILRLTDVDDFLPVRVLALEFVVEMDLFRRDQAQGGVIDLRRRGRWRAGASRCRVRYGLPSALILLDVHRRRELVDRKMPGIDHLDTFSRQEPQFAIGELRDGRTVGVRRKRAEPDAVRRIPNRRFNPTLRVGDPRVQFRPWDAHQAACRVQPQRTIVVLSREVDRIAWQTIPGGERSDAAILNPAQAALLGRGPQRPVAIELKTGNVSPT